MSEPIGGGRMMARNVQETVSLIDEVATVVEEMGPGERKQVRCQGTWYRARCLPGIYLKAGDLAKVVAIDRITLVLDRF
jgi:membrane protein implicated in regulation of membrane protease activity